jgi:hypothetical protein
MSSEAAITVVTPERVDYRYNRKRRLLLLPSLRTLAFYYA